jgi:hypothetical protein
MYDELDSERILIAWRFSRLPLAHLSVEVGRNKLVESTEQPKEKRNSRGLMPCSLGAWMSGCLDAWMPHAFRKQEIMQAHETAKVSIHSYSIRGQPVCALA